jgi:DNA-binding PadR family transcriptional regulator
MKNIKEENMRFSYSHGGQRCSPEGFGGGRGFGGRPMGGGSGRHGHGGGPGGRGRRVFDAGALKLILLKLIADAPRHGYDLIREIEALSGNSYAPSPGVVYPTLTLLADMELVAEQPGAGSRKLFAITVAGTAHLAENAAALKAAFEKLAALANHAGRIDGAPIRRAMDNLKAALRNRLEAEGADSDTMLDVAALIDEAAAKIERLK